MCHGCALCIPIEKISHIVTLDGNTSHHITQLHLITSVQSGCVCVSVIDVDMNTADKRELCSQRS